MYRKACCKRNRDSGTSERYDDMSIVIDCGLRNFLINRYSFYEATMNPSCVYMALRHCPTMPVHDFIAPGIAPLDALRPGYVP